MLASMRPALTLTVLFTLLLGLGYPLAMTGLAQALFPAAASGSLIERDGRVVGSALIGQAFAEPRYLRGRPSAVGHDAANSGGSNLGPTNAALISAVRERAAVVAAEDGVARPPVDLVTASGSGLDPHLSPEAALLQAPRIAAARGADADAVRRLIESRIETPALGVLGEPVVNVLLTNLALDAAFPAPPAPAAAADG
jgi:K+-transporting ATPase ATPase C chain